MGGLHVEKWQQVGFSYIWLVPTLPGELCSRHCCLFVYIFGTHTAYNETHQNLRRKRWYWINCSRKRIYMSGSVEV